MWERFMSAIPFGKEQRNKRTYMMGETCIYYPCSMYCRQENKKGTFGNFVYSESLYFHDLSHFPKAFVEEKHLLFRTLEMHLRSYRMMNNISTYTESIGHVVGFIVMISALGGLWV